MELCFVGSWELSLLISLRYNAAGSQSIARSADAYAGLQPQLRSAPYHNPMSYWSPGAGVDAARQSQRGPALLEPRARRLPSYLDASGLLRIRTSRKTREDVRLRGQPGAELSTSAWSARRISASEWRTGAGRDRGA